MFSASDGAWGFVVIAGFIILGAAIAYAMMRNRVSRRTNARTEQATHDMYKSEDVVKDGQRPS